MLVGLFSLLLLAGAVWQLKFPEELSSFEEVWNEAMDYAEFHGGTVFSVQGSFSMGPHLHPHDLVVVRRVKPEEVRLLQTVVFRDGNTLIGHRFLGWRRNYMVTKGDANFTQDTIKVNEKNLVGVIVWKKRYDWRTLNSQE